MSKSSELPSSVLEALIQPAEPAPPAARPRPRATKKPKLSENFQHGWRLISVRVSGELYAAIQADVHEREADRGTSLSMAEPFLEWARSHYGVAE
jgi:hypothetical protein